MGRQVVNTTPVGNIMVMFKPSSWLLTADNVFALDTS
jgi:hypothetical protein